MARPKSIQQGLFAAENRAPSSCEWLGFSAAKINVMTATAKSIAETSIVQHKAQTFDQVQAEISRVTGIGIAEVKKTIDCLVSEDVLKVSVTPARNTAETPVKTEFVTFAWYERGKAWKDD